MLARLGQRDRDALAPTASDTSDAVDVRLGSRGNVVVHDVCQLLDVEPASRDVGGDDQVGLRSTEVGSSPGHAGSGPCLRAVPRRGSHDR